MQKITKYVLLDILRNRFLIAYSLLLLVLSFTLFMIEDNSGKAILGLMNVVLFLVPLVSLVFSTIYLYNTSEFIELMLSQPIRRSKLLLRMYYGLSFSFAIATAVGMGIPLLLYAPDPASLVLLVSGVLLSVVFSAVALLASVLTRDKARGIGMALILWVYFSFIFDGLVLLLLFQFADYPLETPMIAASMLNPVDLARIMLLLQVDMSAMMGYTGAVFQQFFGSIKGISVALLALLLWIVIPLSIAIKKFSKRDL